MIKKNCKIVFVGLLMGISITGHSNASQVSEYKSMLKIMEEVICFLNVDSDLSNSAHYNTLLDELAPCVAHIKGSLPKKDDNSLELQILWAYLSTARSNEGRTLMISKLREWIEDQLNAA